MLNFEIVEPSLEDVPALAELHNRCWQQAYRGIFPDHFLDQMTVEKRIVGWHESLANSATFSRAARVEQQWAGFVFAGPSKIVESLGEIYAINIDSVFYRQGVGRALLAIAQQDLKSRGFKTCVLGVLRGNQRALKFYDAMGGEVTNQPLSFKLDGVDYPEVMYQFAL